MPLSPAPSEAPSRPEAALSTIPGWERVYDPEFTLNEERATWKEGDFGIATFEAGTGIGSSSISKSPGHKHALADRHSPTRPKNGVEYYVRVSRELTGSVIVDPFEPTPWGRLEDAFGTSAERMFARNEHKSNLVDPDTREVSVKGIFMRTTAMHGALGPDQKYILLDHGRSDDGCLDDSTCSVWVVPKSMDVDNTKMIKLADLIREGKLPSGSGTSVGGFSGSIPLPASSLETKPIPRIFPVSSPVTTILPSTETPRSLERGPRSVPSIEIDEDGGKVRILNLVVERLAGEHRLVPRAEAFPYFTLDEQTLETLHAIASAFKRRSPLFLEGPTAVSKTTALEYFAYLTNRPIRVFSASGQTSTDELIGKYIPNDGKAAVQFDNAVRGWNSNDADERDACYERVAPQAREILKGAYDQKRGLTREESASVATHLGMPIPDAAWVWRHGVLAEAMIQGHICVIDEATLGMPQILERMNSAMAASPRLVLSENGGLTIGLGGDIPLGEGFWLAGTGNSAGMRGRTEFSEAYARRWTDWKMLDATTKNGYAAMLKFMVTGVHPSVKNRGVMYDAPAASVSAPFAELGREPQVYTLIDNLAEFHENVTKLADPSAPKIGLTRHREGGKYVFTRAQLISAMEFIANEEMLDVEHLRRTGESRNITDLPTRVRLAIEKFYMEPLQKGDRAAIKDAMNAINPAWFRGA